MLELSFVDQKEIAREYQCCEGCGYVRKRPIPEGLREYYSDGWQFSSPRPMEGFKNVARWVADGMKVYGCFSIDRAMDVGAKDSSLLKCIEREGINVLSTLLIDPNPQSEEVEKGWIGEGFVTKSKCGLVCATHVLEHSWNVDSFMVDIENLTEEGGFIYIEVPSLEMQANHKICDDLVRPHLSHFTINSLVHLAARHGLSIVRADWGVSSVTENRILLRKGDQAKTSKRLVGLSRQNQEAAYRLTDAALWSTDPERVALYGASEGYYRALQYSPGMHKYKIFDLYRCGSKIMSIPVLHPDGLSEFDEVYIASRHRSSVEDIRKYLSEVHPHLKVSALFYDEVQPRPLRGVSHTGITVLNLERSIRFYEELGLDLLWKKERGEPFIGEIIGFEGAQLCIAHLGIEGQGEVLELLEYIIPGGEPCLAQTNQPGSAHICFEVSRDFKMPSDALMVGTAIIPDGPMRGARASYYRDPDGFTVEIFCPDAS